MSRANLKRMPGNMIQQMETMQREIETLKRALLKPAAAATLSGVIEAAFVMKEIADNVATDVFRINTTDESGSADGGTYAVLVHALITHASGNTASNNAAKSFVAHFARAVRGAGDVGQNTAVLEISETASAATTTLQRDIGTVTMTVVENSEFQCDVQFQVDLTGAAVNTAAVHCFVQVVWQGFLTAPTVVQL